MAEKSDWDILTEEFQRQVWNPLKQKVGGLFGNAPPIGPSLQFGLQSAFPATHEATASGASIPAILGAAVQDAALAPLRGFAYAAPPIEGFLRGLTGDKQQEPQQEPLPPVMPSVFAASPAPAPRKVEVSYPYVELPQVTPSGIPLDEIRQVIEDARPEEVPTDLNPLQVFARLLNDRPAFPEELSARNAAAKMDWAQMMAGALFGGGQGQAQVDLGAAQENRQRALAEAEQLTPAIGGGAVVRKQRDGNQVKATVDLLPQGQSNAFLSALQAQADPGSVVKALQVLPGGTQILLETLKEILPEVGVGAGVLSSDSVDQLALSRAVNVLRMSQDPAIRELMSQAYQLAPLVK